MQPQKQPSALVGSIQKFSTEDGPGVRSTVFLKGCPLRCIWCHNPELIRSEQQMIVSPNKCIGCGECVGACPNGGISTSDKGPQIDWEACIACGECADVCYANAIRPVAQEMTVDEVFEKVVQDKEFYKNTGGGVTISGGEVMMHLDFAEALIKKCAEESINVCLDTSGYGSYETLKKLAGFENVDYVLYDIKHVRSENHKELTGVRNELIIDNLKQLASNEKTRAKIWARMPLIKGMNDSDEIIDETRSLYEELGIKRLSIMGYHDFGNSKAEHTGKNMEKFEAPTDERLDEIKDIFEGAGMVVEITGREEMIV